MNLERFVEDFVWKMEKPKTQTEDKKSFWKNFPEISKEAFAITKQVALYLLLGIALGAGIHGYIPEGFFEKYLESAGIFGVPLAVPLYANASGVIPIIQALIAKGVSVRL